MLSLLNEQCFNEEYRAPYGMRSLTMDEVWIITPGEVVPGAAAAIFGKLKKYNLGKPVRIVSGAQLAALLDRHYPTFWQAGSETPEWIRGQRDRLYSFIVTVQ